jgi:hypothetical protein
MKIDKNISSKVLAYLDGDCTNLINSFGKDFTNDYIDWIFNNFLRIDMSEYVATYPDFTIEGMVEDMSGMFMLGMFSWSEYRIFNQENA